MGITRVVDPHMTTKWTLLETWFLNIEQSTVFVTGYPNSLPAKSAGQTSSDGSFAMCWFFEEI